MTWTKKHDEFAIRCKLRPSTRLLLRWLLRRAKLNEICEIEVDLYQFNAWVAKIRGKGYDRKTIREAIAQLEELTEGMIVIMRDYSPRYKKIIVRPLSFVVEKRLPKMGESPKSATGKPMFDGERKKAIALQQQQDISRLKSLFSNLGLAYSQDALVRLWRYAGKSVEQVKEAVELLLFQNSTQEKKIRNPQGWLIECLRFGWQKTTNLYYQTELPRFSSTHDLSQFVNGLIPVPD